MPITGAIPLPQSGMDAFLNELQRGKENQYRDSLSQQAQANAQRAQVISNLLKGALSGQSTPGNGGTASGQSNSGMDMLYRLGILKPTPQESANINASTKGREQLQKETQESAYGQLPLNASFSAMDKILKDPEYRENTASIKSTLLNSKPMGLPLGSMLQHNLPSQFPSSMVKKLSSAQVHMGNIVVGVGQKFKGPMKQLTANYIDSMKPTPSDSADVQEAKITQLKLMSDFADRQNERIDELSRGGMDPTQAIIQSTKELMPEFQQMVSSSVGQQDQMASPEVPENPGNQSYSKENLQNQAASNGEGLANVSNAQQSQPRAVFVTRKEIDDLAKKKGRSKAEIVALLLKKGHKIEGMTNAKQ